MNEDEHLRQFKAAIQGLDQAGLSRLAQQLLQSGPTIARNRRRTLRRRPLSAVFLFRVRIDLDDAKPPIWRRLELRSDLKLDFVHQAFQAAFGWTDSHLHRFALGGSPFDLNSELFLCPFDVEEGEEDGTPEAAVRLDECLQNTGDELRYVYDYGDSWELTIKLEKVLPFSESSPAALCVDGRRAAPPDDCGGITATESLSEILDDPAHFDSDEVNQALNDAHLLLMQAGLNPQLIYLLGQLRSSRVGDEVAHRFRRLSEPAASPSEGEMSDALKAFDWFLDRAADDCIELTSAGFLKPADVEAASAVVPAMADWIGKNNRENHAAPLLDFRQSLQKIGLLRKNKGRLLLTRTGAKVRGNPAALWLYLAEKLAPTDTSGFEGHAALLILACVASEVESPLKLAAAALSELGWSSSGRGVVDYDLYHFPGNPLDVLTNVGEKPAGSRGRDVLSPAAVALARAALKAK